MADQHENLHFLDYWRVIRTRKEVVVAVFLMVVLTGILVTYAMPKAYMASVIIQVKEDRPDVDVFNQPLMRYSDPIFLRTQFEIIQSAPVIEDVIAKLKLTEKLGRAYGYLDSMGERAANQTFKIVSRNMKVQQYRDTNLIEVRAYLNELGGPEEEAPQLVAEIADEIAQAYRNQYLERTRAVTERALKALLETLQEQRAKVTEAENRLAEVRDKYKINILNATDYGGGNENSLAKIAMANLEASRIKIRLDLEEKKSRFDKVMSLSTNELLVTFHIIIGDPALSALVAEKWKAEVEKERLLQSELGPKHPDVVRVSGTIDELDRKIADALNGLKTGVQYDYEATKAKFEAIAAEMDKMKAAERTEESQGLREFRKAAEEVEHARKIRDALENRYLQQTIEQRIPRTTVEVIQPAKVPLLDDPVRPNVPLNIILSIILGLTAGLGLAYFVEYLDTSVKTIEDIERSMGIAVLGVIPQKVRPLIDKSAEPAHAEAYRVLRTNIQFSKKIEKGKTLCVTSGSVGEGKSLTLFNLAYVCAQLGDKVLIVDSDLHRPRQHKILGVSNHLGLATVLMEKGTLEECTVVTPYPNLHLLPSGRVPSGSHGLMATAQMTALVARLRGIYDIVLFDSPPIIGVSDASLLVREVDGVLLVIQHRKYPRALSSRAKDMITNVGGNLLGVVLNNINISRDHTYYYYQQHYYYYPRRDKGERDAKEPGENAGGVPAGRAPTKEA